MADVLVINDDPTLCRMFSAVLEMEGHSTRAAHDGWEGLALLRAASSSLVVLLDDLMPVMDGLTMLRIASHDPTFTSRHTYLFTTWRGPEVSLEDVRAAVEVPPSVSLIVVQMPCNMDVLVALVEEAAQRLDKA